MDNNTCPECSKVFPPSAKGQNKVYCSRDCSRKAGHKRRSPETECLHCKKPFIPKRKDYSTYCTRECAFEHMKAKPKEPKPKTIAPITECKVCHQNFQPNRSGVLFCSDDCRKELNRQRTKEHYDAHQKADAINKPVLKECAHCGTEFTAIKYIDKVVYCSIRCTKKAMKLTRRARKKNQFVEAVYRNEIIKRDNQTCQLCLKKVDLTKQAPHPLSVTMDHIIPLAKGGTHEPKNIQLAHFICNSRKRDSITGHQLALF